MNNRANDIQAGPKDPSISSGVKSIDKAVKDYFSSLKLKYASENTNTKDPAITFIGMNRSVQYDLKTMREQGWFPAITIKRDTITIADPITYNMNTQGHTIISNPNFINPIKTQNLRLDPKTQNLESAYFYTIPKITRITIGYTITHISRGRLAMNETAYFSDVMSHLLGTIFEIQDVDTGYKYEMKMPLDIDMSGNIEDLNVEEEKEVMVGMQVQVIGFVLAGEFIRKHIVPIIIKFDEGI